MASEDYQALIDCFLELAALSAPSGSEKPVADYIQNYLADLDITVYEDNARESTGGNAGNVICRFGTGGEVVFLAHMDTARPTEDLKPVVTADRIRSDGSTILGADNRAGVAILLCALEKAARNPASYRDFTVAFTVCEETTLGGSRHLALDPAIKMGYAVDSSLRPGHFIHATYGAQRFAVEVNGKAAHAGLEPEKGVNAIWAAGKALANLELGRLNGDVLVNIGSISGGSAVNVVPEKVTLKGEVRSRDLGHLEETLHTIAKQFEAAATTLKATVDFQSQWDFKPYLIQPDQEVYQRLVSAIETADLKPVPHLSSGGSDANSLNAKGILAMNLGIGAQNPHANDEFILIDDFIHSAQIIDGLVRKP